MSLENEFYAVLKEIAEERRMTVSQLVAEIDSQKEHGNLSSACRFHILAHCRRRSRTHGEVGHVTAGASS